MTPQTGPGFSAGGPGLSAAGRIPALSARPRRPAVLDASRTALIPLRPLTVGEILDGGFLIVRRNMSRMLGLPLIVAGGAAVYVLAGVGLWLLLGNTTSRTAQIVLTVLMGLIGLLLLQQFLVWMTAILTRVSLQTVLGEGFAPATTQATLRRSLPLFWPMLGLSMLQYVALGVVQTVISIGYYAVTFGTLLAGGGDEGAGSVTIVLMLVTSVIGYALLVIAYGYLSLTVPALATESRHAPAWIGTPARPTTVVSSFERAFRLVGGRNIGRIALIYGGLLAICLGLIALVGAGGFAIVWLFARSINLDVYRLLSNPWTIFGVVSFAVLVTMSVLLAYVAAVQTLVYLDLRMRREALDLAMRFDCVPIPQPAAPAPVYAPVVYPHAGYAPPGHP